MENHIEIETSHKRDKGFTLVELLIVIVILGILATVTVFAVRGITDKGQVSACQADIKTLQTASESYFAQWGGTAVPHSDAVAANGTVYPAFAAVVSPTTEFVAGLTAEETLVAAKFLRSVSPKFDVLPDGRLIYTATAEGAACFKSPTVAGMIAG